MKNIICCDNGNVGEKHFCTQAGEVVNENMKTDTWEKEFEDKYRDGLYAIDGKKLPSDAIYVPQQVWIKDQIRSLLAQQKQELLAEVRGIVGEDEELEKVPLNHEDFESIAYDNSHKRERNQFRSELRAKLDELEGKA